MIFFHLIKNQKFAIKAEKIKIDLFLLWDSIVNNGKRPEENEKNSNSCILSWFMKKSRAGVFNDEPLSSEFLCILFFFIKGSFDFSGNYSYIYLEFDCSK